MKYLWVKGAREHNLKNVEVRLPRDQLIVVSGMSGSGKSSLAFDTIFAEGQRRYVESLSAYARQFLGRMEKPDLDYIEGLSPAISIEQKTTHRNPRSTVGTITEIFDYLRLLYARIGQPHCPRCGVPIQEQSLDQIVDSVQLNPEGSRIMILAPLVRGKKGEHQKLLEDARRSGFVRVRIDGKIVSLEENPVPEKNKKHQIDIVVDRLKLNPENRRRLNESVETALEVAEGQVRVVRKEDDGGETEAFYSEKNACPQCGFSMTELQPRLFSFNSPYGACPACSGLGITMEFDKDKVMPDPSLAFNDHGFKPYKPASNWNRSRFAALADALGFSLDDPISRIPEEAMEQLLHGQRESMEVRYEKENGKGHFEYTTQFPGILADLKRRYRETASPGIKDWLEGFMSQKVCDVCGGKRLKPESLAVTVGGRNIQEAAALSIKEAAQFFEGIGLSETEKAISEQILKEIRSRLGFLNSVGLDYLSLDRASGTLSGGEAQRIRLATQIGSSLVGVLYILDEPTIGLHQRDNTRLLETLIHLRDLGNTLVVVEHDEQILRSADYIVDMGPGAGVHGGKVVAEGTPGEIEGHPDSLTGKYLSGRRTIPRRKERRRGSGRELTVRGAREHNLKSLDISFRLGALNVITGVSGSGKSTLLSDILYPGVANALGRSRRPCGIHDRIDGLEYIDKVINIDQSPIGRTPRSNPATYVGLFTPIRELFASLPDAKSRGYKPGRFSFNVKGGRCENCQGAGTNKIEMHFLPDVYVTCDVCRGRRFNQETLEVRYKGRNIHEVLEMSLEEAAEFFSAHPAVKRRLDTLLDVGLGYIKLGQSALTLSGGEAQRVKLANELSKRSTGKTLYILDEPTTGLHFEDVRKLMEVLHRLADQGNTIILIEHNLDVIGQGDFIVDLGPEGGDRGGELVASGTPEEIAGCRESYTGRYLQGLLDG